MGFKNQNILAVLAKGSVQSQPLFWGPDIFSLNPGWLSQQLYSETTFTSIVPIVKGLTEMWIALLDHDQDFKYRNQSKQT